MARDIDAAAVLAAAQDVMCRPFHWSQLNCALAACDVIARLHGFDPMARFRADMRGALREVARRGLLAVATEEAARLGLTNGTGAPGDIAVSRLDVRGRCALLVGLGGTCFLGKSRDGMTIIEGAERSWSCVS